ncbi:MAG: peptidase S8 [Clostridiales bacterium]|nr:peptidase S8 [Clostridiales bacterium]
MIASKIDKELLQDVDVCDSSFSKVCIVRFDSKKSMQDYVTKTSGIVEIFDCISAVAVVLKLSNVYNLTYKNEVVYISSLSKVCTLVNVAKDIIGIKYDTKKSSDFSVAVIDTGLYPHLDFMINGRNRISAFIDMVSSKKSIYDDNGHGTAVVGLLAGSGVVSDTKYAGVDNNTNVIVIKALDNNGETNALNILKSMQWVYDNADEYNIKVVCMSFGSTATDYNDPLSVGAEVLWDKGIVVVCACGNSGPMMETIKSPAINPKVISVGAMDDARIGDNFDPLRFSVADFSSRGPAFDNYKPDLVVSGVDVTTTSNFGITGKFYDRLSGTSMATPIVAGVVSRLLRIYPKHTPDQIKSILINSCKPLTGDRNIEGHGWLDLHDLFNRYGV